MSAESVEATIYAATETARVHGYAIAVHGSRRRDLDLVAIPWGENVDTPDQLRDALCAGLDCIYGPWEAKPQGRVSCTLQGGMAVHWVGLRARPAYIDLSVMPVAA